MRRGNYDAIEFLERAWLQLAKFYPPHHFGETTADHFLSQFIAQRFAWHRKLYEPRGPGSSGTRVHVLAGGAVLDDVANAIAETVEGLFVGYCLFDFDLTKWRSDWDSAGQPDDEARQIAAETACWCSESSSSGTAERPWSPQPNATMKSISAPADWGRRSGQS